VAELEWANAWALLLLAGLPVWWWCRQRRRWRRALPHSLVRFLRPHLPHRQGWRFWMVEILWSLVLLAVILALARPRWPDPQARMPIRALAWMLVVDVSGSMAEKDYFHAGQPVSRMEVARNTLRQLLSQGTATSPREDLVGLVTFAVFVQDLAPPTTNHAAILHMLERAEPISAPPESATNIGDALLTALYVLQRTAAPQRRILLLSDGEHNVPEEILRGARHPVEAAQLARALRIPIDTIRVGPDPQQVDDPRLRRDAETGRQTLRQVATLTGGIALDAPDESAFQLAVQQWDRLARPVVVRPEYYRYQEAYPWLGALALLATIAAVACECTIALRVP